MLATEILHLTLKKDFFRRAWFRRTLRSIRGALPLVQEAKAKGFEEIYLPKENAKEAALIEGIKIFGANNLQEVMDHLNESKLSNQNEKSFKNKIKIEPKTEIVYKKKRRVSDFFDIRGQENAKRGLEIAAAGGHNIAMYGPPGTGKTMLARAFSGILPPLDKEEVLEITGIHSVVGVNQGELVCVPPFPGATPYFFLCVAHRWWNISETREATLAHKGVLFLDEFPEFEKEYWSLCVNHWKTT